MKHLSLWLAAAAVLTQPQVALPKETQAEALAAKIDRYLEAAWVSAKVTPAPLADDAEFFRRITLDLAGRIPKVAEVRDFLRDTRPDKRQRAIEALLQGNRYPVHFTNYWRALLLPEASANLQARGTAPQVEAWLRKQLQANASYDKIARAILTAPIGQTNPRQALVLQSGSPEPIGFYVAKEFKPENLAASTARLFLGVRVECAQCHNHPFADWKREQFWGLAAFFAGLERRQQGDFVQPAGENFDRREIAVAGTERIVQAAFLDGKEPQFAAGQSPRVALADWVTAPGNPYFARAAVNRLWAYFLGTGLIEPVDEMVGGESAPAHPELLTLLAEALVEQQFDLKFLIRSITYTKVYQLTSRKTDRSQDDPRFYARMPLRGLTGEQLWDSLAEATGFDAGTPASGPAALRGGGSPRDEFLSKFGNPNERAVDAQTSILQALALMNGRVIAQATSLEPSVQLAAVLDAPFFTTTSRIETLYLSTLSRFPTAKEQERAEKYVAAAKEQKAALSDLLWALLNTSEFILNH